jgi:transmembrane sensor
MLDRARPIKELLRDPVDPARTQAVWQRLRDRRPSRALPVMALALAASAAVGMLWLASRAPDDSESRSPVASQQPARATATALSLRDGGAIPARVTTTDAPRTLRLSDASTIELGVASELSALVSTPTAFATELLRGRVTVEVTPGGPRRWSVRAGSVEVHVIGTRFSVERVEQEVVVRVEHGVVGVTGETVPEGAQQLRAGQSLRVRAESEAPAPVTTTPSTAAASAEPAVPAPPRAVAPVAAPSADQLLAAADRARASGKLEQAASSLAQVLELHASDPRAPLAGLTLGRLYVQINRASDAVSALERATQLGLPKALSEEGTAFLVLAYARAGRVDEARAAAARYRAAFPYGRWSASVREWTPR